MSDDLYFLLVYILLALMLLGVVFEHTWNSFFYNYNVTIYNKNTSNKIRSDKKLVEKVSDVINELNLSQIVFFEKDSNTIYIREKLVQKGPHTVTVMNAVIKMTDDKVVIKGLLNWSVVFAYSAFILLGAINGLEVAVLIILITLAVIAYAYFKQMKMYNEIIKLF
ncbi:hypothetical protein [Marinomonas sp. PE14-40]|uniref:hypothetical protein n=1 Tax=Marinomonas sp. PE14-40 TaxID=3060621 RepID=UPI003F680441